MRFRPVTLAAFALCLGLFIGLPERSFAQQSQNSQAQAPSTLTYELGFSPFGNSLSVVVHAIESAKDTIVMACYEFSSRPIADALIAQHNNGVKVAIVADYKASFERYSLIPYLVKNGIPVRRDARCAILHDKFFCVDGQDVELGSLNYTSAATTHNAENALVLYNVPDIAQRYLAEWQRLWDESQR